MPRRAIAARSLGAATGTETGRCTPMARALLLLATLCAALISGVVFSHALQRGEKRRLPAPVFVQVQNTLYRRYGNFVGPMEGAALVLLLVLLFVLPTDGLAI